MGTKADHDLWGQALVYERLYGDDAPCLLSKQAENLRNLGEIMQADFVAQVAECLAELHSIRCIGNVRWGEFKNRRLIGEYPSSIQAVTRRISE